MLGIVKREALSISEMVREARTAGFAMSAIAMHVELDTKAKSGGMAVIVNGVRIAPCPFEIFRTMPISDDPIMRRLMALEGQQPNDLVLGVTEGLTIFQGFAIRDFGLDPLAVLGAL
jgi:hypothetical protein